LVAFVSIDLVQYFLALKEAAEEGFSASKVSHTAHVGGSVAGFISGIVLGENLVKRPWEDKLIKSAWGVGFALVLFCLIWNMFFPPMTIFEVPHRWCWFRLVYNKDIFGDTEWHCVRCGTQECIDKWSSELWITTTTLVECKNLGWSISE